MHGVAVFFQYGGGRIEQPLALGWCGMIDGCRWKTNELSHEQMA
jgi:hypothetical protein